MSNELTDAHDTWKIVRVNSAEFDALMDALQRAEDKGYLPDAMQAEWTAFQFYDASRDASPAAPQATLKGDEFAGAYAAKRASEIVGKQANALRELLATTPQPTTQFEAWAKLHHYDLTRCSHEPYAAYRSDLTNAAWAAWRGGNRGEAVPQAAVQDGAENFACYLIDNCENEVIREESVQAWLGRMLKSPQYARAAAPQANHYQQLLGVAYVVLGCLAANGVDIPERFLDAFSDPDSVENPLELLPCDFSPARAVRAAVEAALTDDQRKLIEAAADCISEAVTYEQDGFDTPPGPASQWDYNADQLAYALRNMLRADKEGT